MDTKTLANLLRKLDEQSFRPGDSVVASTINHPIDAIGKFGGWLANQVNTAAGIPDQYDNPYPYLAPSPEAQTQAAFDVAGMAQLGSMPFAPKSAGGTVGTFIGPKAATWDAEKAATATKLLDEGVDPAQVWREHLIGRMPDGALFSEIDDSGFKFQPQKIDSWGVGSGKEQNFQSRLNEAIQLEKEGFQPNKIFKLTDMIKKDGIWQDLRPESVTSQAAIHPELANNYNSDNLLFRQMNSLQDQGFNGNYDPGFNTALKSDGLSGRIDYAETAKDPRSTALHELQHAIQQREGWARGGNLATIQNDKEAKRSLDGVLLNLAEKMEQNRGDKSLFKQLYKDSFDLMDNPHRQYRSLTGEAQARATQDRLNMNMDERRNNYPLAGGKLSDIPLEQLIYRYGDNGPAMSASDNLNAELLQKYLQQGSLTPDELAQYERNAVAMRDSNRQYLNVANADAQGGTAMDRAKAMGFFKNYYHGTIDDINAIKTNLKPSQRVHGGGKINKDVFWVTTSPEGAGHFANMAAAKQAFGDTSKALQVKGNASGLFFDKPENISSYGEDFVQGQNIMPVTWSGLRTRYDAQDAFNNASATKRRNTIISAIQDARELGRDAVRFDGVMDPVQQDTMAVLNPKSIRSIFAAFDPLRKDSADLLAAKLLPATMLGLGMYGMEQERRNPLAEALRGQ